MLGPLSWWVVGGAGGVVEVKVDVFVGFFSGELGFEDGGDEGQGAFGLGEEGGGGGVVGDLVGDF